MNETNEKLFPNIYAVCTAYERTFDVIPEARKLKLNKLSQYIAAQRKAGRTPQVTSICTHNSRRSHLAQLWLSVGFDFYSQPSIKTYSGGTVATTVNFRVVRGLLNTGFTIGTADANAKNPIYQVRWRSGMTPAEMFSKVYDDAINPSNHFAAVMVCSQADEECPLVAGCDLRIALPYDDPKKADGTPQEEKVYNDSINEIGREMLYVANQVKEI